MQSTNPLSPHIKGNSKDIHGRRPSPASTSTSASTCQRARDVPTQERFDFKVKLPLPPLQRKKTFSRLSFKLPKLFLLPTKASLNLRRKEKQSFAPFFCNCTTATKTCSYIRRFRNFPLSYKKYLRIELVNLSPKDTIQRVQITQRILSDRGAYMAP